MNTRRTILLALIAATAAVSGCSLLPFGDAKPTVAVTTPKPSASKAATGSVAATSSAGSATPTSSAPSAPATTVAAPVAARPKSTPVTGAEAVAYASRALVINVESASAFGVEHVVGARNVPLEDVPTASRAWSKSQRILVTSTMTGRARSAAHLLALRGFTGVAYLDGGHAAWDGRFAGSSPRAPHEIAKVILVWASGSVNVRDLSAKGDTAAHLKPIAADFEELATAFDTVDVEVVDVSKDEQAARDTLAAYHVPAVGYFFDRPIYQVPVWIVVDKNGRAELFDGIGINRNIIRLYGFMTQESERKPGYEPITAFQTPAR